MSNGSFLVLFTQEQLGIHLKGNCAGNIEDDIEMDGFEDFNDEVTIKNV